MSYINDALRRAQSEKDGRYAHYGMILSAPPSGRKRSRKRLFLFAGTAAAFFAAAALCLFYWGGVPSQLFLSQPDHPAVRTTPENKTAGQAPTGQPAAADPAVLYRTALEAQKSGRLDEAEASYRKLLEAAPEHAESLNNLGVIYLTRGRMQEAIGYFNLARAQKGANADPYYNLACIHARMNDAASALEYLKTAVSMDQRVREWARTDQDLAALRSNPEFKKITE